MPARRATRTGSRSSSAGKARQGSAGSDRGAKKEDIGPLLDAASVLENFSRENAGTSPVVSLLREFAARMMMLFDVGAKSGADFTGYWDAVLISQPTVSRELQGLGPLFRFVYQRVYAMEQPDGRSDKLKQSKAEQQRAMKAEQIQTTLANVQKSLEQLLGNVRQGTLGNSTAVRQQLDGVLDGLEDIREEHLNELGVPLTAVNSATSKARDAVVASKLNQSPRRTASAHHSINSPAASSSGRPPKSPRPTASEAGQSTEVPPIDASVMLAASVARGTTSGTAHTARQEKPPGRHESPPRSSPRSSRQPHPSLPALQTDAKPLRSHQQFIELPLRPFASPFAIPALFDVDAFEKVARDRRKHAEWRRSQADRNRALVSAQQFDVSAASVSAQLGGTIKDFNNTASTIVPTGPLSPQKPAVTAAQKAPVPPPAHSRDDADVAARLRAVRAEVLGDDADHVVITGRDGRHHTLPAADGATSSSNGTGQRDQAECTKPV